MIKKAFLALMLLACFGWGYAQTSTDLKVTNELQDLLNEQSASLTEMQADICKQVDELSNDVKDAGNRGLTYPNWVRFVQIAEAIESLNDKWNNAYGDALDKTIDYVIQHGLSNVDEKDEYGQDLLSEIFEEKYLIFS